MDCRVCLVNPELLGKAKAPATVILITTRALLLLPLTMAFREQPAYRVIPAPEELQNSDRFKNS